MWTAPVRPGAVESIPRSKIGHAGTALVQSRLAPVQDRLTPVQDQPCTVVHREQSPSGNLEDFRSFQALKASMHGNLRQQLSNEMKSHMVAMHKLIDSKLQERLYAFQDQIQAMIIQVVSPASDSASGGSQHQVILKDSQSLLLHLLLTTL